MVRTTKDIIKVLPFEEAFKLRLISAFDKVEPHLKADLIDLLWDAYDAIYDIRMEQNIALEMEKVLEVGGVLDENFYSRVEQITEDEMKNESIGNIEKIDLSTTRKSLENLIGNANSAN